MSWTNEGARARLVSARPNDLVLILIGFCLLMILLGFVTP